VSRYSKFISNLVGVSRLQFCHLETTSLLLAYPKGMGDGIPALPPRVSGGGPGGAFWLPTSHIPIPHKPPPRCADGCRSGVHAVQEDEEAEEAEEKEEGEEAESDAEKPAAAAADPAENDDEDDDDDKDDEGSVCSLVGAGRRVVVRALPTVAGTLLPLPPPSSLPWAPASSCRNPRSPIDLNSTGEFNKGSAGNGVQQQIFAINRRGPAAPPPAPAGRPFSPPERPQGCHAPDHNACDWSPLSFSCFGFCSIQVFVSSKTGSHWPHYLNTLSPRRFMLFLRRYVAPKFQP